MKVMVIASTPITQPVRIVATTSRLDVIYAIVDSAYEETVVDGRTVSTGGVGEPPRPTTRYVLIPDGTDTIDEINAVKAELEADAAVEVDMDGTYRALAQPITTIVKDL